MKRVLLVTNIPTPYRLPLFDELGRQLTEQGLTFKVLFGTLGYGRRKWELDLSGCQFDYDVLTSRTIKLGGNVEKTILSYGGLGRHIDAFRPDVVVLTGFSPATIKVWVRSWTSPLRYIVWTGSTPESASRHSVLRVWQRKMLVRRASGFIAYGSLAKDYLHSLGAPLEQISVGINTVDTHFFRSETEAWRDNQASGGTKYLTCIGYLSPRKQIRRLLEAVRMVAARRRDFVVDIVGDGQDRPALEEYTRQHGLGDVVAFHGYRQREELPPFLARSSGLLFSTRRDIWGLVMVEAMAAGLPVVASVHAGATTDLVEEGVTGFAVDFDQTDEVAARIEWLLDHPEAAAAMGRSAQRYVGEHLSIPKSARGFVEAITRALEPGHHEATEQEPLADVRWQQAGV